MVFTNDNTTSIRALHPGNHVERHKQNPWSVFRHSERVFARIGKVAAWSNAGRGISGQGVRTDASTAGNGRGGCGDLEQVKNCNPVKFFHGFTWHHELLLSINQMYINTSFKQLLNERDKAVNSYRRATYNHFWAKVIDDINNKLNRIRINETPLRPSIFVRASYS